MSTSILLFLALAAPSAVVAADLDLELVSVRDVAPGTRFADTCVGGLSALAYDAGRDRYLALSDAARGARFYVLDLPIEDDGGGARLGEPRFERVVTLQTREGEPYPDDRIDPEGLALLDAGTAFVSSEGQARSGVPPFVDRIELAAGAYLGSLPIPASFVPREGRGVRQNLGFEALALVPDHRGLVVASESALAQEAPEPAPGVELFAHLLQYDLTGETPRLAEHVLYPLRQPEGDVLVHGLVELLALGERRFLAMERTYGPVLGLRVSWFAIDLDAATTPPAAGLPVLVKTPVLDFAESGLPLENFEGMTLGPRLADGGESLVVVGDNDDTECASGATRPTRFLLFRLRQ